MQIMVIEQWATFAVIVGGASAGLTGLLFVAVSLNLDRIAASPLLEATAAQTLLLLVSPLVIAVLIAVPGQPTWVLGVELMATALLMGAVLFILTTEEGSEEERRVARLFEVVGPSLATIVLILVCGISLIAGRGGGLYWLVPAVLVSLLGGITNAWLFMIRLPRHSHGFDNGSR